MRWILCFLYLELCPIDWENNLLSCVFFLTSHGYLAIQWIRQKLLDKKLQIHRWIKRDWIEALTKHCRRLNRADQSHWDGDLQKNQRIALKLDILRKQCVKNVTFKNCLIWWVTFWIAQSSSCLREAMLRRAMMVADLPLQHWECEK